MGFNEVVADAMWIRVVQDLDYCEQSSENEKGVSICVANSWLYQMIDTITRLSPKFRAPYAVGSLALTILISDIDGATKIFDKAVQEFPNDWPILYRAAYHYMYEVKDNKKAAELLVRAGDNGAPPFTKALAGRLYSDSGSLDLAEKILQDMIQSGQDPLLIERLERKIRSLKDQH